jgi:hypothetical protein
MKQNNHETDNFRLLTDSKVFSSRKSSQSSPTDVEWGIDTVNLSFPVNLDLCESDTSLWSSESSRFWSDSKRSSSQVEWDFESEFANVKVVLVIDKGICNLRFNAARLLTPKSRNLLQPRLLEILVGKLLEQVRSHVWPDFDKVLDDGEVVRLPDWSRNVRVTRLDAARNLFIDDIQTLKDVLVHTKPKYGKTSHLYWDSKGGWTLTNETKRSGKDRIYDKDLELHKSSPDEKLSQNGRWFRFEAQLQKDRLKSHGLASLADVSDLKVWKAIESRWDKCMWGVKLPEGGKVREALYGLSPTEKVALLGFLAASLFGITHDLPSARVKKYSKMCSQLGLTPGVPLEKLGVANRELSLWEGRIIQI